jgi:hypothetical protein
MGTMGTTVLGSAAPRDSDRRDITRICPGRQCQAKGTRGQGDQGTNKSANLNEADTQQAVGDGDEGQVDVLQGRGGPSWTGWAQGRRVDPVQAVIIRGTPVPRAGTRGFGPWICLCWLGCGLCTGSRLGPWNVGACQNEAERGGRIEGGGCGCVCCWVLGVFIAGCWVLGAGCWAGLGSGRAQKKSERARRARRTRRTRPARGRWFIARQSQTPWQSQRRASAGPAQAQRRPSAESDAGPEQRAESEVSRSRSRSLPCVVAERARRARRHVGMQ